MKLHLVLFTIFVAGVAGAQKCPIDEDFTAGRTQGARPQDPGEFTPEGWRVASERTQIKYDLGKHYRKGSVELEIRGPLNQPLKRTAFAAWNEEAGADGDRKTQGFYQLRFQEGTMMLRLTYRAGGRSFEGKTDPVPWQDKWYKIRGTWDTAGGESHLWLDGKLLKSGKFNSAFEGFRWVFIGKDNYQQQFSIPGVVYRKLKVCVED